MEQLTHTDPLVHSQDSACYSQDPERKLQANSQACPLEIQVRLAKSYLLIKY
jgi:hypothetical protein